MSATGLVCCEQQPSAGQVDPRSADRSAAPSSSRPAAVGSGARATTATSTGGQPSAATTSSAAAETPERAATPKVHCSAAGQDGPMFLGRIMGFRAGVAAVDDIGPLLRGRTLDDELQLRRVAKNPATEPALKQPPPSTTLIDEATEISVHGDRIYYLLPQKRFPFNSRLSYLQVGVEDPKHHAVAEEVCHILNVWDGWLYVLRQRDEIDEKRLTRKQVAALRADRNQLWGELSTYYRYDLLRIHHDGKLETIGPVPWPVDGYHDGYVYGRITEQPEDSSWGPECAESRGIYRTHVTTGEQQVIHRRNREQGEINGRLLVDADGVFFFASHYGKVFRIDHTGSEPEPLKHSYTYAPRLTSLGEYLLLDDEPILKNGGTITWRNPTDALFGKGKSGCGEVKHSVRDGNVQFVGGRRSGQWDSWGFVYEYLPGGVVNARRFKLKRGHELMHLGADDECLYYVRSDYYNTWLYAMARPTVSGT